MKLGLVAHPRKKTAREVAQVIVDRISEMRGAGKDVDLVIEDNIAKILPSNKFKSAPLEKMRVAAVICVGGDGSILRTFQYTKAPVLGVNVGSLGFLMDVRPEDIERALTDLVDGDYSIDERAKVKTVLNGVRLPDATNEAVIITSTPSKIQEFDLFIDDDLAQTIRADGIIISTPTGSTSYALSAGGSVLDPRVHALEIIPIAPFRINSRPFIIPDGSLISLNVVHRSRAAQLVIDGYFRKRITFKDRLSFTRSEEQARFVRLSSNFYEKFQEKIIKERPSLITKGK